MLMGYESNNEFYTKNESVIEKLLKWLVICGCFVIKCVGDVV